jgi:putative RNA 2'-phosphotransferase
MNNRLVTISKFLSKYLRHEPEALSLTLEPGGWVSVEDLLVGASTIGFPITAEELAQVVADNDKQRFSFNETGSRIRANQGHSTEVDLQLNEVEPPDRLYHGTVAKFVDAILAEGLRKMNRHDVHLSKDVQTATKVGERRGKPVILVVESGRMAADGYKFRLSANGVWLTDHVPPQYLRLLREEDDGRAAHLLARRRSDVTR